jgi:hypothetical protein
VKNFSRVMGFFGIFLLSISLARASDVTTSATTKVLSQYVGTTGVVYYDRPVLQSDIFVLLPRGFYFDIWWSTGFDDNFSGNFDDELNWTLGWSRQLPAHLTLDLGIVYYDTYELFDSPGPVGDTLQPYLQISRGFNIGHAHSFIPFVRLEYQSPLKKGMSSGLYTQIGVGHTWSITNMLSLGHELRLLHDSGAFGFESALIGSYKAGVSFKPFSALMLTLPSVQIISPLTDVSDERETEIIYGFGLNFTF